MAITNICVLGAGIMGAGIAQAAATAGFTVTLRDIKENLVENGLSTLKKNLQRAIKKGTLSEIDAIEIQSRITGIVNIRDAVSNTDLVIEAIVEDMEVKKTLFRELDGVCPNHTIFASNTSGLSITEIAAVTGRPDKVVGMHFFNPVSVMKLVELIRGFVTSDETISTCMDFVKVINKTAIEIKEAPGFAVNRILCPMINEAIFTLAESVASAEDIDRAMVLGANHPIGPLALGDMIGLDTLLFVLDSLQRELGEDKYRPAPLLRKMVRAGHLGRKTGRGFFDYTG